MKLFFPYLLIIPLSFFGCKDASGDKAKADDAIAITDFEVLKSALELRPIEGKWYYQGKPFNGYSLKYHPNDTLGERLGYYQGKREGVARKWSENGVLRIASHYKQNRLVGRYRTWWENGVLASESHYVNGTLEGIAKEWYPNGQLAKERHLVNSKEQGLQKAWLQNGKLYVNYEAKDGRIFGMRRANSCYQLEDEVVVKSK
ncbi:toxin-antitoxin system YwqK family antitoxin [Maribacter polysaccharolyticus]|uniref:toxin-antitoxin system YwqK family antitoxin n=1 Tax=Maribacter polysaccharolyticus TaxID=3020831 RepID=UPI00237F3B72|nr:toxin-antitoxin system YwqK family antitoxin [Maribacter polysaccharolyticus]MDE3742399.1 toxin-antitoxin system YwqK family antitoxin [Maribacter polysaccharolyticus]